ncbi:MAG: tRNA pseudouridine(55) synthase TruB [Alphaproteobacteria bacterium]
MARKRRGRPIHGWMVIDKPSGITSARVVAIVRSRLDAQKAGHGGTLDPLATGILPIALGEATKTVAYVMDGRKDYRFSVRWGEARDTDDAEGAVTETSEMRPGEAEIRAVLGEFTGDISQVPPAYSAIKVDGKRAFALARAKQEVKLEPRIITIEELRLVDMPDSDHATFEVRSGKGAYMRSLARDIAVRLGTVGHIVKLRRTAVGPFSEDDAISLDYLDSVGHSAPLSEHLLSIETALDDIPALALNAVQADHLRHGRPVRVRGGGRTFVAVGDLGEGEVLCAMADGRPVALARFEGDEIRPMRVLNV